MTTDWRPFLYSGQTLCILGAAGMLIAAVLRYSLGGPSVLFSSEQPTARPTVAMRLEVYLGLQGFWSLFFGAVIWRGVRPDGIDLRTAAEERWGIWQPAEWIYLCAYVIPYVLPLLPRTRAALREYCQMFLLLMGASMLCFFLLPWYSPPRTTPPTSWIGGVLAWEMSRKNFAAASFPSYHVLWALLLAGVIAPFGRFWTWAGYLGAAAMMVACIANGAHAVADVAASVLLYVAARWVCRLVGRRPVDAPTPPGMTPAGMSRTR